MFMILINQYNGNKIFASIVQLFSLFVYVLCKIFLNEILRRKIPNTDNLPHFLNSTTIYMQRSPKIDINGIANDSNALKNKNKQF